MGRLDAASRTAAEGVLKKCYSVDQVAEVMAANGLEPRTPAKVRQAVGNGALRPELQSPDGAHFWTERALHADLVRQHQLAFLRAARPRR